MRSSYKSTVYACFIGYIVQAIVNNYIPLLFLTFQSEYSIPLDKITALITVNFAVQLIVDLLSSVFVDKIGYRASLAIAHVCSFLGLLLLTFLPDVLPSPFTGILISVMLYAVGGGLIEVLISPVMDACPSENKEKAMSLLHSFYSWGQVGVVVVSTAYFAVFGIENRIFLTLIWSLVPLINLILFLRCPLPEKVGGGEKGMRPRALFKLPIFWYFILLMTCAGAAEQAVSQWCSAFAEKSLGLSKAVGDLLCPTMFAAMMGVSRMYYGKRGDSIKPDVFMLGCGILCLFCYLAIGLSPSPILGIICCALTGFGVGIMWPGTFSKASHALPHGGTTMFAYLALAGDLGCSLGPSAVGFISGAFSDNLKLGILFAAVFPLTTVILILYSRLRNRGARL